MSIFIVQAVERSADRTNSVRVVSRWPIEADHFAEAKAFIDATPRFDGFEKVDTFEVVTTEGKLLAQRSAHDDKWTDV